MTGPHQPGPPPTDATSPLSEQWLVTVCGKEIALTVRFVPGQGRGMTRIELPQGLARVLGPA